MLDAIPEETFKEVSKMKEEKGLQQKQNQGKDTPNFTFAQEKL